MKDEYEERDRQRGVSDDKRPREWTVNCRLANGWVVDGPMDVVGPLVMIEKSACEQVLKERDELRAEIYEFRRFPHRQREEEQRALITKLAEALQDFIRCGPTVGYVVAEAALEDYEKWKAGK